MAGMLWPAALENLIGASVVELVRASTMQGLESSLPRFHIVRRTERQGVMFSKKAPTPSTFHVRRHDRGFAGLYDTSQDTKSSASILKIHEWPRACRYFDQRLMDTAFIGKLLTADTSYHDARVPWLLDYTYIAQDGCAVQSSAQFSNDHDAGIFGQCVLTSSLSVIHMQQKRLYLDRDTVSATPIDSDTWLEILHNFEVLPSFLELLHSNNGGTLSWTSFEADGQGGRKASAFHVGYKMGDWGNDEVALYSRRDLATGRSVVLIAGTRRCLCVARRTIDG
ncbi:hypothetical protein BU23DRAFT_575045 [Bimuria novae-zelandiae CBS 107.79]|uniref:Uncharacterized protein n=1 Tax=Bimuria novae-zelandiae CBS 107.79 TaxID=1447943 RepID=A0A6A5UKG4_9PLEO|nr:hypothetical protein BU23DRAFT_575045 [Bimuria novae-zelandiae CBS 107.79]